MTHMQHIVAALVIFALANAPAVAQDRQAGHHSVGQNVTLTSCVEKAQGADTFILSDTADVPVHPATHGRVVYWLDSVKPLREHVGHQVRIQGSIAEVTQEEMEVKLGDDGKGGWMVEIEGPGKDVKTTPPKAGVETADRKDQEDDIKTTLVKVKVADVTMVAPTCQP
jgi:hypothetical protein